MGGERSRAKARGREGEYRSWNWVWLRGDRTVDSRFAPGHEST